jgi:hypothetical protein
MAPAVEERLRDVMEYNRLVRKWQAFINAWERATSEQQRRLEENWGPIGDILDGRKEPA